MDGIMEKVFVFVQTFLAGLQDQLIEGMQAPDRDRGAGIAEYALLVALIALIALGGITIFGEDLSDFFGGLSGDLGF
jgi:pilus assembly protein Flp/PilA